MKYQELEVGQTIEVYYDAETDTNPAPTNMKTGWYQTTIDYVGPVCATGEGPENGEFLIGARTKIRQIQNSNEAVIEAFFATKTTDRVNKEGNNPILGAVAYALTFIYVPRDFKNNATAIALSASVDMQIDIEDVSRWLIKHSDKITSAYRGYQGVFGKENNEPSLISREEWHEANGCWSTY